VQFAAEVVESRMSFAPRILLHPGPKSAERVTTATGSSPGPYRLQVVQGADLCESVSRWISQRGCRSAAFRFLHGNIQSLQIMTGKSDLDRGRVATFHGPHTVSCPALLLGCHGVAGTSESGYRIHAHGVFLDSQGNPRGCHLIPRHCIAGEGGVVVALYPIDYAYFHSLADAETGFDLFVPMRDVSSIDDVT
jgi:predicted DNA-binding protein with PD1-like motif